MQITIVVPDKTVIVGGVACNLPNLDVAAFQGAAAYDQIHAVQYNTESGQGHIEYCTVTTTETARPNLKPDNWAIDA